MSNQTNNSRQQQKNLQASNQIIQAEKKIDTAKSNQALDQKEEDNNIRSSDDKNIRSSSDVKSSIRRLKQSGQGQDKKEQSQGKKSVVLQFIRTKVNSFRNIVRCEICQQEMKIDQNTLRMSKCEHSNFCESCLHHYAIYKVKNFQQVLCPRDGCNAELDTESVFFSQLPLQIQRNYKKIHRIYLTLKDPNLKPCPRQNCQGIIRKIQGEDLMSCDACNSLYCSKCMLAAHEGLCDKKQVQFLEQNMRYRQCKRCKFVVERSQGCNKITCRCGFHFCYVCGADWDNRHYHAHGRNGIEDRNIINNPPNNNPPAVNVQNHPLPVFQVILAAILKAPMKLILLLLALVGAAIIFGFVIGLLVLVLFAAIIAGIFWKSILLLSQLQGLFFVLGIIFFPVLMIAGAVVAVRDTIRVQGRQLFEVLGGMLRDWGRCICDL